MVEIIGAPTLDDALASLSRRVAENEARGGKTLIFCEDRLTLLAERAALVNGGTLRTEVTTFARFLSGSGRVLSKHGSVMAVSSVLEAHAGELKCFSAGSAQTVYETVAQLYASRVDAAALFACAEQAEGILKLKLQDLALISNEYTAFLAERGLLDENGYLALLPSKIARELNGTDVIFFAFPSFTQQALEGVRASIEHAASTVGIFLAGRDPLYTNEGARAFRTLAEETGETSSRMEESSLEGDAKILSAMLFSPASFSEPPKKAEKVHLFRAKDEEDEMHTVCALIRKYVAEKDMRFRDIALLVPDKQSFLLAEQTFSAYHIPMFADRRRPFSEHPLCAFLLSVLAAAADGGLPESVDAVLSSVYFGKADEYRNYLLRFGAYRGGVYRNIKEGEAVKHYNAAKLIEDQKRAAEILHLVRRTDSGKGFAESLRRVCEYTDAERITSRLQKKFSGAEREFLELAPLWNALDELEEIAGERRFTAREFSSMLKSGLSALEISMIPQYLDAVFVGDVTESKLPRARVLFAIGLTDALPRTVEDTAVISDKDMEKLLSLKVRVEPAIAVVNARARESMALNLCAFSDALYLGCPERAGGEEARVGEAFSYARRIFLPLPMPEVFPYDCCEKGPAARALLQYKEGFERGKERDAERFSSLHAALSALGEKQFADSLAEDRGKPPVAEAEKLYFSGEISPTLLEAYFACPYAGFASRALRLREREERAMQDRDAGSFVHAVLEETAKKFNEFEGEEACRAYSREQAKTLLDSPRFSPLCDTDAGRYAGERLIKESVEASTAAYRQLYLSAFRVRATEGGVSIPSLSIAGRTDRVDEADGYIRIIDYKTGAVDDRPVSYYTGRKLQLQLYLLGASDGDRPAGAFYFPAAENFLAEGDEKYRMRGFFSKEDSVLVRMDPIVGEGKKSAFFEGGGRSEKGLMQEDFENFLHYSLYVADGAEREMRAGNISPSPYEEECTFCKFKGMCGYVGEPRREEPISCARIAAIVAKENEK